MKPGARLLFVKDPFPDSYDLVFLATLYYRDPKLFITQLDGPMEQRVPVDKLGNYDHVFSYEDNQWVEYDARDIPHSLRFHTLKGQAEMADSFQVGDPNRQAYIVQGLLLGPIGSDSAWTLDNPELRFKIASTANRELALRFVIVGETLKKTGPLKVEFFVNNHLLDRATYSDDGERTYRHPIPPAWLTTEDFNVVRMHILNPYVAPRDGAKLGVLLKSASLEAH